METPPRLGIGSLLLAMTASVLGAATLAAQEPKVTLGGRVVDARGEPMPVAEVWVTEVDDMARVLARGLTDADGVFRVARVPLREAWEVFACGDGGSVTRATTRSAAAPVLLCAQPALRLGGTLRHADGSPAVGVEVRGIAFAMRPPIDEFAVTDAEGRWCLEHLRPGPCSVVAALPGEGLYACNGLQLDDVDDVELRGGGGGAGRTLTVQLRGMPPGAAGKVFVELAPENGFAGLPRPWHHAALDTDGEVTLTGLPNVAYRVTLLSRDVLLVRSSIEITPDAAPRTLVFEAMPEPQTTRTMTVRLRDAAGQPLRGVPLRLGVVAPAMARPARAVTDAKGEARFDCLVATDTTCVVGSESADVVVVGSPDGGLAVVGENWLRHVCVARDGAVVDVLGTRAVQLCGRVLDADGAPIGGKVVGLGAAGYELGLSATLASTVTGPDGTFSMPVRPGIDGYGEVVLTVGSGDIGCCSRLFELAETPRLQDVGDLRLPTAARLEVRVVDTFGAPVRGEVLELHRLLHNTSWAVIATAITDADGRATFAALQPGERQVSFKPRAGRANVAARPCRVEPGKVFELEVTIAR